MSWHIHLNPHLYLVKYEIILGLLLTDAWPVTSAVFSSVHHYDDGNFQEFSV